MQIDALTVVLLLALHFVGDFILQTDRVANGKSSDFGVLTEHVVLYAVPLAVIFAEHPGFVIANAVLHWSTDVWTSRLTSRLWAAGERHWFFTVIGLDQLIHGACLVLTAAALHVAPFWA